MPSPWHFWIDVGGTFTDCIACKPDGLLVRHKLLSSGVTKGSVAAGSTASRIVDPARRGDPPQFWSGYVLRLLDARGAILGKSAISVFDATLSRLHLTSPLAVSPASGQAYELTSDEEAPIVAIRYLMGLSRDAVIPPIVLRLGTTRGTNALITRTGAQSAFITTRGFGDLLHIGYQNRPKLFELAIHKPTPLFAAVVEIEERITHDGKVPGPLNTSIVRAQLAALKQTGIESLAICLLHASQHPTHELAVAALAREIGFREISLSHEVAPIAKMVPRGDTTVMDAYLNPVLRSYVAALAQSLPGSDLRALTSSGNLVAAERFRGKDSILSGPAGGAIGYARVAQAAGFSRAIGFDMGGTSTDVSRFDGRRELEFETEKSGVRVVAPMLAIHTVAAGGGSICRFDGVKLVVGPASAGADPGPACYGRAGPLTVTDVNLFLGRIVPEQFPFPLDRAAVERRLAEVSAEINKASGRQMTIIELADGFIRVANSGMAQALRSISVAKGCDPRDYILIPFGGAAGQHACSLAAELGMRQILFHPDAGLLSALGAGQAEHARQRWATVYQPLDQSTAAELAEKFSSLEVQAREDLAADLPYESDLQSRIEIRRSLDLRYVGVDAALTIAEPPDSDYAAAFSREHEKLYGYVQQGRAIEVVTARVEAALCAEAPQPGGRGSRRADGATAITTPTHPLSQSIQATYFDGTPHQAAVYVHDELSPGTAFTGPAIVLQQHSTVVLEPGWNAEVLPSGELLATSHSRSPSSRSRQTSGQRAETPATLAMDRADRADPIQLEIFNNHFAGIAEQMGIALRNTSVSVNVKERLDFSCAIFTSRGELVVNAPHVPVHLGAMSETLRHIIADNPDMQPGDVFASNDPYRGGSHIPDVTVVTPVFMSNSVGNALRGVPEEPFGMAESTRPTERHGGRSLQNEEPRPLFFTASRAHHAEIGGITPGSMPPFSRNLAEEGVLLRNVKLIDSGRPRFDELRQILSGGRYPSRAVEDNISDIAAQVAANRQGALALLSLVERFGRETVEEYMTHLQVAAAQKLRRALTEFPTGRYEFTDHLDDSSPITVAIEISACGLTIDFTGTGPVLASNLNAPPAVTKAAVMYVLRTLIGEDIPLNDGIMAAVRIILPECLLNPLNPLNPLDPPPHDDPARCPAVAGGNVETSQRVVDVLLGALGVAAASQGTMNNLIFGDDSFGYYETICGGAGATPDADGADAVHTHMTNTRLTDPEILERRFPVRLLEFSIRRGSGGAGKKRGGDGVVRRIEFLKPLTLSIVSQRRGLFAPYGVHGGGAGAIGKNILTRATGQTEMLECAAQVTVEPGDVLTIETPGGGAYGTIAVIGPSRQAP
jgi:5-oxoprolinase (ATP-hydrolysing)